MYEGSALWFRKLSHSEVLQLRKIGVNDFIEIVDNDEASFTVAGEETSW